MKFSLARPALALAIMATLASCGGGGKATYPVNVTVTGLLYPGLTMSTNGMDVDVAPPAKAGDDVSFTFPNEIEYGVIYNVVPKGANLTSSPATYGKQPLHQTCLPATTYPRSLPHTATAGQLARIQVNYDCTMNAYPLTGVVKGLTGTGLVVANGSSSSVTLSPVLDANNKPTGADVALVLGNVVWNQTYGVTVLTQPTGQTCKVTAGGDNGTGGGTMTDTNTSNSLAETKGVTNLVVTCVASS
ncbi:hypothetical protein SAMN05428966_109175 [Massilia sp. PDC64]|nr:hypothetical protein [Massilia sp. PDC64]SDE59624.1 hypothetical protein SAMN05428966_109175 [Massilia sp. PDC64]